MKNKNLNEPVNPSFLVDAVNKLITYNTPQRVVDFVKKEKIIVAIGNPKFKK